jgi:hypothetical protein
MAGDKLVTLAVRHFFYCTPLETLCEDDMSSFLVKQSENSFGFRLLLWRHGSHLFALPSCQSSGLVKQKIFNFTHCDLRVKRT